MRARSLWALALAAGLVATTTAPAAGTDPVDLGSGYIVDTVDVISDDQEAALFDRLSDLYDATGVDLYAVFVDEFTNPADAQSWADDVAAANGLGPQQYLLAVAVDGRQYYISADTAGPLTDAQVAALEESIVPDLRDGDYAGAVETAADGIQGELESGISVWVVLLLVATVISIGVLVWLIIRRRRTTRSAAGSTPATTIADLERQASSALVQTDDAVKTSEQELGFARAQFGDKATAEFVDALATARRLLDQAFTLKQRLDDEEPDSDSQKREWNQQIISLCGQANAGLDDKAEAFDELRRLEQDAPQALSRAQDAHRDTTAALDDAQERVSTLAGSYAPEALATVADNPEQARERLAFAGERLSAADRAIAAGDRGDAAVAIRAAEDAIAQADLLEQAVHRLAADLTEAERGAQHLLADLEQDVVTAATLPDPDGRIAGVIAATRAAVEQGRDALTGPQKRPLMTVQALEDANARIDGIVQEVRDRQEQARRATQMLDQQLTRAQAQVSAAEDYITARRGAVGAEARTRLAEAGAALVRAQQLRTADPAQALPHAQRADQLAAQAIRSAQGDVGSFAPTMRGSRSGGGDMMGAVLGGIVMNSLLSGGGSARGRRGASRSRGGSSRGGFRPASFGGGGTRGRRGGGRF
ncbi:TPM domain-containing protein [Microbacterium sp. SSW1-59]|uniref:TPM domain-containing protein n=1 Tax=Microbacterium xanthum TaxID=3079794 RepID=UPI002AD44A91|nr:TPM domain-containing protein [Microbacterium sp. SSW1-59]MDZ8201663.1 TPM domain-containing protein [Microbacterium sp. SSW1-59]